MTESNSQTRKTNVSTIMASGPFIKGWHDYIKGNGFNVDAIEERYQWRYERGRLFACYVSTKMPVRKGQTFKNGRKVPRSAIDLYLQAKDEGAII